MAQNTPTYQTGILNRLPLTFKLFLAFALIVTAAVLATVFLITSTSSTVLVDNAERQLSDSASIVAQNMIIALEEEISTLKALSLNRIIQSYVSSRNTTYTGSEDEILAQLAALDQQWAAAGSGDLIIQNVLNNAITGELQEFRGAFPENLEIFATDQWGAVVASTSRTSDYYQADEEWWQVAWANGKGGTYIGQPEYDDSVQSEGLQVALPLYAHDDKNPQSEVIGVMRVTLNFNSIAQLASQFKFGETGHTDLLFPNDRILESGESVISDVTTEDMKFYENLAQAGFQEINHKGTDSLLSFTPFSALSKQSYIQNLGWGIIAAEDRANAFLSVTIAQQQALVSGAIITVLAGLVGFVIAYLIGRPVARLSNVAAKIAQGDFNQRSDIRGNDEIGQLGQELDNMAGQLQNMVYSLESRVEERTRDLRAVADVNTRISSILELERLLQDVTDLTKERFGLYHAHIYRLNEDGTTLQLAAGAGHVGREMVAQKRQISIDNPQSIVAQSARSRKPITINDVRSSPTFLPHPLLPSTRSELAVPLVARGELLGVLDVQSDKVSYFNEETLGVLELMAGQIATAVSNAALYQTAERTSRHERALGNIERRIQLAGDVDEVLKIAVRELGKALRVPYTSIELRLPENMPTVANPSKE